MCIAWFELALMSTFSSDRHVLGIWPAGGATSVEDVQVSASSA